MRAFLAVSYASGAAGRRPDERAVDCLASDGVAAGPVLDLPDGWVVFAGADPDDRVDLAGGGFTVRIGRTARTIERDVPTAELAGAVSTGAGLTAFVPPFAAVHRESGAAALCVAGDWLGFHQLYWWSGDGVAAVSTSARALAVLAGGGLSAGGVGAQALIGWQVGDATLFGGVRVLPPATLARLHRGELHLRQYAEPPARPQRPPALDDAVAEMADILRGWQSRYVADHPDAVLQLTGGHDSRILLAAIPQEARTGLRALTLGDPDSPDAEIAARLAAPYRMRHEVYLLDQQDWPTPERAQALALHAARALECHASPLALFPLLLAEAGLEQGHRLSGLGGEVARGFYYGGQPSHAQTSPHLVERLAAWRLFSNEAVEPAALDPGFRVAARDATLDTLIDVFPGGDWLRSTDEFYLYHRMHRWAGAHGTVAAVRRHYVNPMFDRRFVELALAVAPADKRNSLLLGRLLGRLDPALTRIPLDSGITPARLASRSMVTRLATGSLAARRTVQKVRQRLSRSRRPQLGVAQSAQLLVAHWRAEPAAAKPLYSLAAGGSPVLHTGWLDGLLAGAHDAQPTTVAFLVDMLAAAEAVG